MKKIGMGILEEVIALNNDLLAGEELHIVDNYLPTFMEVSSLHPDFPEKIDKKKLFVANASRNRSFKRLDVVGIQRYSARHPGVITISPTFTKHTRVLRETIESSTSEWPLLSVDEASIEGEVIVEGKVYEFNKDQPIITATSQFSNLPGSPRKSSMTITLIPHLDHVKESIIGNKSSVEKIPFTDTLATPLENLLTIIKALKESA